MGDTINETNIIEQLNAASSVRGFFIAATRMFEQAIDTLTQRIFRSNYLTVKSVIDPLLEPTGLLGDSSVRLKLLFGLGVVADQTYHDIAAIENIKNLMSDVPEADGEINQELHSLQIKRTQTVIRSSLSLAVIEICDELNINSPFVV